MAYHITAVGTEVRCPRCKGFAVLDTPWETYTILKYAQIEDTKTDWGSKGYVYVESSNRGDRWVLLDNGPPSLAGRICQLGHDRVLVEKYPYLQRRDLADRDGTRYMPGYVVKCTECHLVDAYELNWPQDAYFQWDIRGQTLWAYSRKHAVVLLDFIKSDHRDEAIERLPEYGLHRIPGHFISAKVRDLVVKEISSTLGKTDK